jgi:hypothetical protein
MLLEHFIQHVFSKNCARFARMGDVAQELSAQKTG